MKVVESPAGYFMVIFRGNIISSRPILKAKLTLLIIYSIVKDKETKGDSGWSSYPKFSIYYFINLCRIVFVSLAILTHSLMFELFSLLYTPSAFGRKISLSTSSFLSNTFTISTNSCMV
jgi:hypothetical protein